MFEIRELSVNDYSKKYFELLHQLTPSQRPSLRLFEKYCNHISKNDNHKVFVIEENNTIIASITLLIEYKFIHGCSIIGHIEDFIIDNEYRNRGLGKMLIQYCIDLCKNNGCYKIILNCKGELQYFYEKCGFLHKNIEMSLYL